MILQIFAGGVDIELVPLEGTVIDRNSNGGEGGGGPEAAGNAGNATF
jgi:hypothetical protein